MEPGFYIIGTPIGNLKDLSIRGLEILKLVDVIYCEDTRRSLKLLNAYEIRKPLKACPHFREKDLSFEIVDRIRRGERVGFMTDAGMPGISDPGQYLVNRVRTEGLRIEVIGGVSALTYFLAGLGRDLESFKFVGFLPARKKEREDLFRTKHTDPVVFMESTHRIESTLKILDELLPNSELILGKELSKISEQFFVGKPIEVAQSIKSFKGEWMGYIRCSF